MKRRLIIAAAWCLALGTWHAALQARVILVPDDFQTIQEAVNDAAEDAVDTVLLGDGTYTGANNINIAINRRLVLASRNGAANCIIDCEETADSRGIFLTTSASIVGLTITRAAQNGIRADNAEELLIERCLFLQNRGVVVQQSGGGLQLRSSGGLVRDCIFDSNTNVASGGGAFATASTVMFSGCLFLGNRAERFGGGLLITNDSNVPIFNCIFAGNSAGIDGGGVALTATSQGSTSFCTLIDNEAAGMGGGLYKGSNSNPTVMNSIFWGNRANTGSQLAAQDNGGEITIGYCVVEGGPDEGGRWNGEEIITDDPLLTEGREPAWGVDGFFLGDGSLAIDAGLGDAAESGMDTLTTRGDLATDEGRVDIGFHYWIGWFRIVGRLYGWVLDAANDRPLEGAVVTTSQRQQAVTDAEGRWEIPEALATTFDITAAQVGYISQTFEDQELAEGEEMEINFRLTHPEFAVDPEELVSEAGLDDTTQVEFRVVNDGNGQLTWNAVTRLRGDARRDPWELRASLAAAELLDDNQLYGVAFDGEHYYVSGANGANPSQIYVLSRDGEPVGQFQQRGSSRNGMRDLAWDGELLWGASDRSVIGFTTEGDSVTSFEGPVNPTNSLAFDSQRNLIWASGITTDISGYDRRGNRVAIVQRGVTRIYGLACRPDDPDGATLYIHGQTAQDARQQVFKVNPDSGDVALLHVLEPEGGGSPEGAEITTLIDPYSVVLLTVVNSDRGDRMDIWQLDARRDWMVIDPTAGAVEGGAQMGVMLNLISTGFDEGEYEAEILFTHNAAGGSAVVPIRMVVTAGPVHAVRQIDLAFGWNLVSLNLQPDERDFRVLARDLTDAGLLLAMKDDAGRFYIPSRNFYNMQGWDVAQGYWVKMRAAGRLTLEGTTVRSDDPIDLDAGWQSVAYFPRVEMDVAMAFGGVIDELQIAKDGEGRFFAPRWEFNSLSRCRPGIGYSVRMSQAARLIWGEGGRGEQIGGRSDALSEISLTPQVAPRFLVAPASTGLDMSLLVLTNAAEGSEVGASAGGRLVGAGAVSGGKAGIAVRGDDPTTLEIEGAAEGEEIQLQVVDCKLTICNLQFAMPKLLEGELTYRTNGVAVVMLYAPSLPTDHLIVEVRPNPFNAVTNISMVLPVAGSVKMAIYDLLGREVAQVAEGRLGAGRHTFRLDGSTMPSGVYLARLQSGSNQLTKRIVLMK